MLENYEILDLIYKEIEEMNECRTITPSEKNDNIQSTINYLFNLVDKIKKK